MKTKSLSLLLAILLVFLSLTGCTGPVDIHSSEGPFASTASPSPENTSKKQSSSEETWAVYWYLCGSDLESEYGSATSDLSEMLKVALPPNVQVIIQTGGAKEWKNSIVQPGVLQRYLYDSNGLHLMEEQPDASMGDPETLSGFLRFCKENYPANHTMVLLWNHGGGSVAGAAFDEVHGDDSLTLDEMYQAFRAVYDLSFEEPPFDVVGFDTCLMATVDVAYTFCDIGRYLVASQELEPGNGWYYCGWLQALADNPAMDGEALGRAICDTYVQGCELENTADDITLSVVDLSAIGPLMSAYENIGQEALAAAVRDPSFFSELGREAARSENYGGNNPEEGYTNMVDLGHLVRNSANILPQNAQDVLNALEYCVVYKVNGPYRAESTGLSCYYSYDGSREDFAKFTQIGASESFKYFYSYELEGTLDENGREYLRSLGYDVTEVPEVPTLQTHGLDDYPVTVSEDAYAVLDLGPQIANLLRGVYFNLAYMDVENDLLILLGRDNDIYMDWENGIFKDNFRGVWGAIDGHLVYMELLYEGDSYNTYTVPILLNGEEYNLRVIYDYTDACYYILGARKGLNDTGMADKNLVQLQPGDQLSTMLYASSISGDDDFVLVEFETFVVTEDTAFSESELPDGYYLMLYEMVDAQNQSALSDGALFTVLDGTIYVEEI